MSNLVQINNGNFESEVLNSKEVTVVDFWAEWCGPCKMIGPFLEEIQTELDGIKITKLNVDENQELSAKFGIRSIPTLLVFKDGKIIDQLVGALPKEMLKSKLAVHL
ncbi:MAG: thioredoxin [Fusobacteriia bacterium 4572_132]|nr:MAG: thioredoxin [Fusobacteriia bacterium 4572_132]